MSKAQKPSGNIMPEAKAWNECRCHCHDELSGHTVEHAMPCCSQCPHCGLNITGNIESHIAIEHPDVAVSKSQSPSGHELCHAEFHYKNQHVDGTQCPSCGETLPDPGD